ncbi:MAG: hypothetical protein ER33_01065 [Cyanobium sp. CACIAM 14]|nr:MAG: hypothetical protein ER33_01065 [Cyanobium sp. CACIAM 14]
MINTYSSLNIGDAAIYSALAALLGKEYEILAAVGDDPPRMMPGLVLCPALPVCDVYLSVGGDIFNNSREWFLTRRFLGNLSALMRYPDRTILFGQSIPASCHGFSFQLLVRCLRRLPAICVRDALSHRRLLAAGIQARLSYDTAFALQGSAPAREHARSLLRQEEIDPTQSALISVRPFSSMYRHNNERFVAGLARLCRLLADAGLRPLLLLQSLAHGPDHDAAVAAEIAAREPRARLVDPFHWAGGEVADWDLLMAIFQLVGLIIGVRYHTCVLALAAGRLPYNLHYSNKGRDLSERLGIPGIGVEHFDPDAQFQDILRTAERRWDPAAVRDHVGRSLRECLRILEEPGVSGRHHQ